MATTQTDGDARPFTCSFVSITIAICDVRYSVDPIPPGEDGSHAYRLTKRALGHAACDVIRTHGGTVECSCPDYESRHRDAAETCKHGRALVELGLMPTPAPALVSEHAWAVTSQAPRLLRQIQAAASPGGDGPCCPAGEPAPCIGCSPAPAAPNAADAILARGIGRARAEAFPDRYPDEAPELDPAADFDPAELNEADVFPGDRLDPAGAARDPEPGPEAATLDLAGLIEHAARSFEIWPTGAGALIAEALNELASKVRITAARTPAEFRARVDELDRDARADGEAHGFARGLEQGRREGAGYVGPLD